MTKRIAAEIEALGLCPKDFAHLNTHQLHMLVEDLQAQAELHKAQADMWDDYTAGLL